MRRHSFAALGVAVLAVAGVGFIGTGPASAHDDEHQGTSRTQILHAKLTELNNSGAQGWAVAAVSDKIRRIVVHASGLTPDAPHAQHIHYGLQALHECPTLALDANKDGRLTTSEGVPAYGGVLVSLTTSGDTSPGSVLAVPRYPVADDGTISYSRSNIEFAPVAGAGSRQQILDAIKRGEGVVVIHGVDYDHSGTYNSSKGASDLDPTLPAEVTDPALCGVLH
jgi:hypothetical protein